MNIASVSAAVLCFEFWQNQATTVEVSFLVGRTSELWAIGILLGLINLAQNIVEVSKTFCYSYLGPI